VELEILLEPRPSRILRGHVLMDGRPIEAAKVRLFEVPPGPQDYSLGLWQCVTGPAGAFEIARISDEAVRAVVTADAPGFAFARSEEILLPLDGPVDGVAVHALPGANLEVRVTDLEGRPLRGAWLELRGERARLLRQLGRGAPGRGVAGRRHLDVAASRV
jgi:hypothetical protein